MINLVKTDYIIITIEYIKYLINTDIFITAMSVNIFPSNNATSVHNMYIPVVRFPLATFIS